MTKLIERLTTAITAALPKRRLGAIYTGAELANLLGDPKPTAEDLSSAVASGRVIAHYSGGSTNVAITVSGKTNRSSTLHEVGPGTYSLDAEAAIQAGAALWLEERGFVVRPEFPDQERLWDELAATRDLAQTSWDVRSAGTACRDLVALRRIGERTEVEIWEVKGRTAVKSDFYDTFGQIFPIDDPTVTKGWTDKSVPKHGRAMRWAERLADAWRERGLDHRVSVGALVPDLPTPGHALGSFYTGTGRYYPEQAELFARFARSNEADGDGPFPRLLRHLGDKYRLADRIGGRESIGFRFLGYQGIAHLRDFATGEPVVF